MMLNADSAVYILSYFILKNKVFLAVPAILDHLEVVLWESFELTLGQVSNNLEKNLGQLGKKFRTGTIW